MRSAELWIVSPEIFWNMRSSKALSVTDGRRMAPVVLQEEAREPVGDGLPSRGVEEYHFGDILSNECTAGHEKNGVDAAVVNLVPDH